MPLNPTASASPAKERIARQFLARRMRARKKSGIVLKWIVKPNYY